MDVLSIVHRDSPEKLGETYGKLYGCAEKHGIISDEFCREVYSFDVTHPGTAPGEMPKDRPSRGVEVQFVIHQWNRRLAENAGRVLGEETKQVIMQGSDNLGIESSVDDRFRWVKGMVERMDDLADEGQKYDILSVAPTSSQQVRSRSSMALASTRCSNWLRTAHFTSKALAIKCWNDCHAKPSSKCNQKSRPRASC